MPRSLPRLSPSAAYFLVAAIIGLALYASVTPSPLYDVYQEAWGFSSFTLTAVFAVYAACVLVALLLAGGISDDVGRRPVLISALVVLLVATGLFLAADGVGWLFAARALQGLATGVAMGAAGAALLDLHPRGDGQGAGLTNGVASAVGMGFGALISAALVQFAPLPRHLPFIIVAVLFALLLVGAILMPEPVTDRRRLSLRPQRPRVPAAIRGVFLLSALGVLASWSIGGLYMSLGPRLASQVLNTDSHLAGGVAILGITLPGALTQLLFQRAASWRLMAVGALVMGGGIGLVSVAISIDASMLFLIGAFVSGSGWGCAFLGALRSLTAVVPDHHRAEVMSAFYVVAYASLSIPALGAGLAVSEWGLVDTFRGFGVIVVALSVLVAIGATRSRPRAGVALPTDAPASPAPVAR